MAAMSIGAFVLIFALLLNNSSSLKKEFKNQWQHSNFRGYFIVSSFLSIVCALSLLGGILFPLGYGGKFVEVHFLRDIAKIWYFFWPCLLVIGLKRLNSNQIQFVLNSWLFTFGLLSILGCFQYFYGWPRPQSIPGEPGRFHATLFLGHHLSVASIFIFPFFVALDLAWFGYLKKSIQPSPSSWIQWKHYLVFAIFGLFTLILTYSRTLWLALPLAISVWVLLSFPKKYQILGCGLLVLIGLAASQTPSVQRRLHTGIGIVTRENLWLANLEFLKKRPFTGAGWHHNQELSGYYLMDKFKTNDVFSGHAHNNFLDLLGSQGILGTLSWTVWCLFVFWLILKPLKNKDSNILFARGLFCAWLVFHINGLTQVNFWEAKVEHQLAWVIAWTLL
jgi:O-antigen ligase